MPRLPGFLSRPFEKAGGWDRLAVRYGTDEPLPPPIVGGRSVMLERTVAFKFCVDFASSPDGLWVHPRPRGLHDPKAILIPWAETHGVQPTRLYRRPAVRLLVGDPPAGQVTLHADVWEELGPGRAT